MRYEKIEYRVTANEFYNEETGRYVSYGICAFAVAGEHRRLIEEVLDISLIPEKVRQLAEMMEKHNVLPVHFRDVLEDFFVD